MFTHWSCSARCQPACQEEIEVQFPPQGHFNTVDGGARDPTGNLTRRSLNPLTTPDEVTHVPGTFDIPSVKLTFLLKCHKNITQIKIMQSFLLRQLALFQGSVLRMILSLVVSHWMVRSLCLLTVIIRCMNLSLNQKQHRLDNKLPGEKSKLFILAFQYTQHGWMKNIYVLFIDYASWVLWIFGK